MRHMDVAVQCSTSVQMLQYSPVHCGADAALHCSHTRALRCFSKASGLVSGYWSTGKEHIPKSNGETAGTTKGKMAQTLASIRDFADAQ